MERYPGTFRSTCGLDRCNRHKYEAYIVTFASQILVSSHTPLLEGSCKYRLLAAQTQLQTRQVQSESSRKKIHSLITYAITAQLVIETTTYHQSSVQPHTARMLEHRGRSAAEVENHRHSTSCSTSAFRVSCAEPSFSAKVVIKCCSCLDYHISIQGDYVLSPTSYVSRPGVTSLFSAVNTSCKRSAQDTHVPLAQLAQGVFYTMLPQTP